MTVYIEYVILENFIYDFCLLQLALRAGKAPVKTLKISLSALFGGVFALLFPLLNLSKTPAFLVKIGFGFLLVFLAIGKNGRGRYGLSVLFFFCFAFVLGGAIYAYSDTISPIIIIVGFTALICIGLPLVKKAYKKITISKHLYNCAIAYNKRVVDTLGFLDTGNLATYKSLPICFVSPDLFYQIFGIDEGQGCDETYIQTVGGEKKIRICLAELIISEKALKKRVYFGISNSILKSYKILLNGAISV